MEYRPVDAFFGRLKSAFCVVVHITDQLKRLTLPGFQNEVAAPDVERGLHATTIANQPVARASIL
jgi:hypothetical protein